MPLKQLTLKIQAEDTPLTVIVEPLGWDYTLAPEQSAWFVVEAYDESGYLEVSPGGERYLHLWLEGATSDSAQVIIDGLGEVQSGFNRALSTLEVISPESLLDRRSSRTL
jgi:hypothetical protein